MADFTASVRRLLADISDLLHLRAEQIRAEGAAWREDHQEPEWDDTYVGMGWRLRLIGADLLDMLAGYEHA